MTLVRALLASSQEYVYLLIISTPALDLLSNLVTFDPAKRLTVLEALKHPYLEAYHDEDDEPECESKYDHWKEIEKLDTIDQFRTAIWNEVEEFRREVREMVVESDAQVTTNGGEVTTVEAQETSATTIIAKSLLGSHQGAGVVVAEPMTLPPVEEDVPVGTIPFPSSGRASPSPAGGPAPPLPRQRPASARTKSNVDPYEVYARRSSLLASASPQTITGTLPPGAIDPNDSAPVERQMTASYVVPARSRAASAADSTISATGTFPRTILRTLSTLSVNDAGAAGVALGRAQDEKGSITAADAPPSSIPLEFRAKKS
jgi:serine/threonine protein kinase